MSDKLEADGLLDISTMSAEVISQLGYLPAAFAGALAELNADLVNHHKRSVIKHHGFAKGYRARRFVASRISGYGRKKKDPTRVADASGETFASGRTGRDFPIDPASIRRFEYGGSVSTSKPMAVPIGAGRPYKGPFATAPIWSRVKGGLASGRFHVVPNPGGGPSLIIDERESAIRKNRDESDRVVGIMVRRRHQPAKLGFHKQWAAVWPRHKSKYDEVVSMAITSSGRAALSARTRNAKDDRRVGRVAFDRFMSSNEGDFRGAKKASLAAQRLARSRRVPR